MEGRDADSGESVRKIVDVNLYERRQFRVLRRQPFENGPYLSARTTPRRREIHDQ